MRTGTAVPRKRLAFAAAAFLILVLALAYHGSILRPTPVDAASFLVTTDDDAGDGTCDATCTLRDAIDGANATADGDEITFADGITDIQLDATVGQLVVASAATAGTLTIDGGAGVTVRRDTTGAAHRIFLVSSGGDLTLVGITVTGGSATGALSADAVGGGIFNNGGTLILTNSAVSGNTARVRGGGIHNNPGTATLTNSTVSGNTNTNGVGGGISNVRGELTLTNSTVSGNMVPGGQAGGIYNSGGGGSATVTATNSTISGNSANGDGGGILNDGGSITILTNSTVTGNSAGGRGGGIRGLGIDQSVTLRKRLSPDRWRPATVMPPRFLPVGITWMATAAAAARPPVTRTSARWRTTAARPSPTPSAPTATRSTPAIPGSARRKTSAASRGPRRAMASRRSSATSALTRPC